MCPSDGRTAQLKVVHGRACFPAPFLFLSEEFMSKKLPELTFRRPLVSDDLYMVFKPHDNDS